MDTRSNFIPACVGHGHLKLTLPLHVLVMDTWSHFTPVCVGHGHLKPLYSCLCWSWTLETTLPLPVLVMDTWSHFTPACVVMDTWNHFTPACVGHGHLKPFYPCLCWSWTLEATLPLPVLVMDTWSLLYPCLCWSWTLEATLLQPVLVMDTWSHFTPACVGHGHLKPLYPWLRWSWTHKDPLPLCDKIMCFLELHSHTGKWELPDVLENSLNCVTDTSTSKN